MSGWSKQWPKEPGLYWFYGLRSFATETWNPELYVVRAHRRGPMIVIEGLFEIVCNGWFQTIESPALPKEAI